MDDMDRAVFLDSLGLSTEGLGPIGEWSPADRGTFQVRHAQFWSIVGDMIPEDELDEPFWMSEDATIKLQANTLPNN